MEPPAEYWAVNREEPQVSIGQRSPSIHILFDDLGGEYAIEVQTPDGETYCVVDEKILDNNQAARSSALEIVSRAIRTARHRIACAS